MLEDMKLKDVIELVNTFNGKDKKESKLWKVGETYFIRTVTMYYIGKLEVIDGDEFLLSNVVWVAHTGRFNVALQTGLLNEVELYKNDVIINRNCIVDATVWDHPIPTESI